MSPRGACVLAALLLLLSSASGARAATAECIPSARFSVLARIADGGMTRLAELVGLPGKTPPADGCRAILLAGPLTKGSAAALLTEISRNKGWLAKVYIAVGDSDLREEIEIAGLVRAFRLSGEVLLGRGGYIPDFLILPERGPPSVSNSWIQSGNAADTPLDTAFRDYLENTDRKIVPKQTVCGAGCWTILAAAAERRVAGTMRTSADDTTVQTADDLRIRELARLDFGPKVTLVKQAVGYLPIPRMASYANVDRKHVEADCKPAIDFATTLGTEIAEASNRFAEKRFPYMRLQPLQQKVRRFADAAGNAELCVRKTMTQLRMAGFAKNCEPSCEDRLKAIDEAAGQALARYAGQTSAGQPSVATAPTTTEPARTEKAAPPSPTPPMSVPPPGTVVIAPSDSANASGPREAGPAASGATDAATGDTSGSGSASSVLRRPQRRR